MKIPYVFTPFDPVVLNYPGWKHLIPVLPTENQFIDAWKAVYGFLPKDCVISVGNVNLFGNDLGMSVVIQTTTSTICAGDFFSAYTDQPTLAEDDSIWYSGYGCTWGSDTIGDRYYKIDPKTLLPIDWAEAYSKQTITRYISANKHLLIL